MRVPFIFKKVLVLYILRSKLPLLIIVIIYVLIRIFLSNIFLVLISLVIINVWIIWEYQFSAMILFLNAFVNNCITRAAECFGFVKFIQAFKTSHFNFLILALKAYFHLPLIQIFLKDQFILLIKIKN